MKEPFKIVVAGGGTAGWLTALYMKQFLTDAEVTVIESDKIGILGAGEGVTPAFVQLMDHLNIEIHEIVKHCDATLKNGIKFTNWNGDGNHFYHNFQDHNWLYETNFISVLEIILKRRSFDKYIYSSLVSEQNKTKFIKADGGLKNLGNYAVHFDAVKLANFLQKKGEERGILVREGIIGEIKNDEEGFITGLVVDGSTVDCDFVFDCTGLHRLIIGKHFNTEWIDYTKFIPNKRAQAFSLPVDDVLPPYTEAIAMKFGWIWKIPLQTRYGCGYVFDSDLVSDEEIKAEILNTFPSANLLRVFNFRAGSFKDTWVKNCIAVGLSSGFIEPLEATSIQHSITTIQALYDFLPGVFNRNQTCIDQYNNITSRRNQKIADFIQFHYLTKRNDTEYWRKFKSADIFPNLNRLKELSKTYVSPNRYVMHLLGLQDPTDHFPGESFLTIGYYNGFYDENVVKEHYDCLLKMTNAEKTRRAAIEFRNKIEEQARVSIPHKEILDIFNKL